MVEVRDLRKSFQNGDVDVHALRGVNLDIRRGEFVAVVGPSGSGKSTLFHVVGGLTPPTAGRVTVDGRDLVQMTEAERTQLRKTTVGFVFQKFNLLPTLSVRNNIRMVREIATGERDLNTTILKTLETLGIDKRLDHKPRALSGGEQQRVAIARAIVNQPAILLAFEPTDTLTTENSQVVLQVLRDLNERLGQTILMITHDAEAAAFAHRTVKMRDGCIVQ